LAPGIRLGIIAELIEPVPLPLFPGWCGFSAYSPNLRGSILVFSAFGRRLGSAAVRPPGFAAQAGTGFWPRPRGLPGLAARAKEHARCHAGAHAPGLPAVTRFPAGLYLPSTIPMTSFFTSGHLSKPGGLCPRARPSCPHSTAIPAPHRGVQS